MCSLLLLSSQTRKSTIFMWKGQKKAFIQDAVWFYVYYLRAYTLGRRIMEIYIYHCFPWTISNRVFSNLPVFFFFLFFRSIASFYISNQISFSKYHPPSRIFEPLSPLTVWSLKVGSWLFPFLHCLSWCNHYRGLSQSILKFNLRFWFLGWPCSLSFKAFKRSTKASVNCRSRRLSRTTGVLFKEFQLIRTPFSPEYPGLLFLRPVILL